MAQFGETTEKESDDEDKAESYTLKHLAGHHNQKRHAWRYSSNIPLSKLKKQRKGDDEGEWKEYKARVRAKRAGKPPGGAGGGKKVEPVKKQTRGEIVAAKLKAVEAKHEKEMKSKLDARDQAHTEYKDAMKERSEIWSRSIDAGMKGDKELQAKLRAEYDSKEAGIDARRETYNKLSKEYDLATHKINDEFADALRVDDPAKPSYTYDRIGKDRRAGFDKTMDQVAGITNASLFENGTMPAVQVSGRTGTRANYEHRTALKDSKGKYIQPITYGSRVNIKEGSNRVLAHEIGHHIEYTGNGVQAKANEFWAKRTAGEPVVKLSSVFKGHGYGSNEVTKVDKWMNAYMGKIYNHGLGKGPGSTRATELISMGIEYLLKQPMSLLNEDPDYFYFLIGVLQGD